MSGNDQRDLDIVWVNEFSMLFDRLQIDPRSMLEADLEQPLAPCATTAHIDEICASAVDLARGGRTRPILAWPASRAGDGA